MPKSHRPYSPDDGARRGGAAGARSRRAQFRAAWPDQLWVADITYVPTRAGFLYLAVVVDAWSRRVVGWAMETHLRTELLLGALDMAVAQHRPTPVIHHSDQDCQYTSVAFGTRCRDAGVRPSMGGVGDAYDNALCKSFFATLECELLIDSASRRRPKHVWPCSTSSKAGTTRGADIPRSLTCRP